MAEVQHTLGPWRVEIADGWIMSEDKPAHVARMRASCVTGQWEADARLIAAAPELLAALQLALSILASRKHRGTATLTAIAKARAAIARAEGR